MYFLARLGHLPLFCFSEGVCRNHCTAATHHVPPNLIGFCLVSDIPHVQLQPLHRVVLATLLLLQFFGAISSDEDIIYIMVYFHILRK